MKTKTEVPKIPSKYTDDVNSKVPRSYWDYNNYDVPWKSPAKYAILKKIGRGKYSAVFTGVNLQTNEKVCIKHLKPVRKKKIKREIKILENIQGGPNIIKFYEPVRVDEGHHAKRALVFEYINNTPFKELYAGLSENFSLI